MDNPDELNKRLLGWSMGKATPLKHAFRAGTFPSIGWVRSPPAGYAGVTALHVWNKTWEVCFSLNFYISIFYWASLVAQMVKNPPAIWDTWVRSLSWEDLLEKGMPTHSSIPAWRIPWTEEPGVLQPTGLQRIRHDWTTNTTVFYMIINNQASVHVIFIYT